jgi:hypothetical protein
MLAITQLSYQEAMSILAADVRMVLAIMFQAIG